jgi:hypothetical protein
MSTIKVNGIDYIPLHSLLNDSTIEAFLTGMAKNNSRSKPEVIKNIREELIKFYKDNISCDPDEDNIDIRIHINRRVSKKEKAYDYTINLNENNFKDVFGGI